jgi:hypothetical protein
MDDAGQRLSRLFLTQLMLNAGFGIVIGAGLWLIGVPPSPSLKITADAFAGYVQGRAGERSKIIAESKLSAE